MLRWYVGPALIALGLALLTLVGCASVRDAESVLTYRTSEEAENECNRRGASWARSTWDTWLAYSSAKQPMPWNSASLGERACFDYATRTTIRRERAPSAVIEHENTHAREGEFHP